jgi:hypothetical protein
MLEGNRLLSGNTRTQQEQQPDYPSYKPKKDPMAGMTEEEKEQHRREIRILSRKTFSIAYGIIGGAMAFVV